jgi:hypothetical protein
MPSPLMGRVKIVALYATWPLPSYLPIKGGELLTKEFISKASLLKNLPLPFPPRRTKEGFNFLPLEKGGQEGFCNRCLHTYDLISISA